MLKYLSIGTKLFKHLATWLAAGHSELEQAMMRVSAYCNYYQIM